MLPILRDGSRNALWLRPAWQSPSLAGHCQFGRKSRHTKAGLAPVRSACAPTPRTETASVAKMLRGHLAESAAFPLDTANYRCGHLSTRSDIRGQRFRCTHAPPLKVRLRADVSANGNTIGGVVRPSVR